MAAELFNLHKHVTLAAWSGIDFPVKAWSISEIANQHCIEPRSTLRFN
jgi:hypothetical protein